MRVSADNRDAVRQLKQTERRLQGFANRIGQLGKLIGGGLVVRGAQNFLGTLSAAAGQIEVIDRRFNLLFGRLASEARFSARTFAKEWNTSLTVVQRQFATFRALFTPLGTQAGFYNLNC